MVALTEREEWLAHYVTSGLKNPDIAKALGTSEYVVKNRLRHLYDKLGFYNRVELALWYTKRTFDNENSGSSGDVRGSEKPAGCAASNVG